MIAGKTHKEEKLLELDFGSIGKINKPSLFGGFRQKDHIRPVSGTWALKDDQLQTLCDEEMPDSTESIALFGSGKWTDYTFAGHFTFMTQSMHPDEGGIILYVRYKNKKNHYSYHFCYSTKRIELWKRFRSQWSMVGEGVPYAFQLQHLYAFSISCDGNTHLCHMDREPVFQSTDADIHEGCAGLAAKYCSAGFQDVSVSRRIT